jgi:hypothetical protein
MYTWVLTSIILLSTPSRIFLLSPEVEQKRDVAVRLVDDKVYALCRNGKETADTTDGDMLEFSLWELTGNTRIALRVSQETADHSYFVTFHVDGERVIVQDLQQVLVFQRSDTGHYTIEQSQDLGPGYMKGRVVGDSMIVYNDIRLSMSKRPTRLFRSAISMRSLKEGQAQEYAEGRGVDLSFVQPRRLLDCGDRLVAVADPADYRIRVHDRMKGAGWVITASPDQWVVRDSLPAPIDDQPGPQKHFGKLLAYVKANSVINSVTIVDDTTICVCWTVPTRSDTVAGALVYDLWQHGRDEWSMVDRKVISTRPTDAEPYAISDVWSQILDQNDRGLRIDLVPYPAESLSTTSWPSRSEYNAQCDAYFVEHDLHYALVITPIDHRR